MPTTRARHAFTLIELLIVITVIMILMGLLVTGVGAAMQAAARARTVATMQNIESAVARYQTLNGDLPLIDIGAAEHSDRDPVTEEDLAAMGDEELDREILRAVNRLLARTLASIDRDNFGPQAKAIDGEGHIVDSWDMPFVYRTFMQYPTDADELPLADQPRPDSYQLWSFGPNRENDDGEADDLANWNL